MKKMKRTLSLLLATLFLVISLFGCGEPAAPSADNGGYTVDTVPEFSDRPYVEINNNVPQFSKDELKTKSFERYSELDTLGRCGVTEACISIDIMPTEDRGAIGQVKPSGWHTVKYDNVDGKYLYNRCHLIGFQLTGENANTSNLITGTRYMNTEGMLPFENLVAEYVEETHNHVMYRVTPIFDGDNLVARGVQMEAMSVEDEGRGISFNVYVYNSQPGISINYKNGDSCLAGDEETLSSSAGGESKKYILKTNSKKFHEDGCSAAQKISPSNKKEWTGDRKELLNDGYEACKFCNP